MPAQRKRRCMRALHHATLPTDWPCTAVVMEGTLPTDRKDLLLTGRKSHRRRIELFLLLISSCWARAVQADLAGAALVGSASYIRGSPTNCGCARKGRGSCSAVEGAPRLFLLATRAFGKAPLAGFLYPTSLPPCRARSTGTTASRRAVGTNSGAFRVGGHLVLGSPLTCGDGVSGSAMGRLDSSGGRRQKTARKVVPRFVGMATGGAAGGGVQGLGFGTTVAAAANTAVTGEQSCWSRQRRRQGRPERNGKNTQKVGSGRRDSALLPLDCRAGGGFEGGGAERDARKGGRSPNRSPSRSRSRDRGPVEAASTTTATATQTPVQEKKQRLVEAVKKSEWESILQERLERKLNTPKRKRRARGTAAGAGAGAGAAAATAAAAAAAAAAATVAASGVAESPPSASSLRTQGQQQERQQQRGSIHSSESPSPGESAGNWTPARSASTWETRRRDGRKRLEEEAESSAKRTETRRRLKPPPLKKWPPGGPFGASKSVAWHAQQVVQSAVTPLQAMRAVLDRPHRSNYVSVSTAVNRVAKLASARRRGGGLRGEEESKYLGILLKVTEELVDADMMNARNLAQLLWSLAKLGNPGASEGRVLSHPEKRLREIGPLRFANGSGSGSGSSDGKERSPLTSVELPRQTNSQRLRLPALLAGKLSERAMECKPQELAMAAWGVAVLGERDENLMSAIAEEVTLRAGEFQGKELGNIVWAFAVLDFRDTDMLDAVAEVLSPEPLQWQGRVSWEWKAKGEPRNGTGNGRSGGGGGSAGFWKATIDRTWAMKIPGGAPEARPAAMVMAEKAQQQLLLAEEQDQAGQAERTAQDGREVEEKAKQGEPGETSSSLKESGSESRVPDAAAGQAVQEGDAGAKAAAAAAAAVDAAAAAGGSVTGGGSPSSFPSGRGHWTCASEVQVASVILTPQDLAMLSWGFSTLSQECLPCQPAAYRALAVLAKAARECAGSFSPQDISMLSLALARMSWDDPPLMEAMAARTMETLRAFKPQELSNTAWAYGRLYVKDPRFWSSLQKQAKRMLAGPGMKAQEIANLAWALAVMGQADFDLLKDLLRSAQAQRRDMTLIESHQLYQVYLLWGKDMPELWEELDARFLEQLRRRWTDNQQRTKRSSLSHLEVSQTLDLMQISHENESEHDIDIEIVGVGLASEDWDFRSFAAGTGPNPADPAEVRLKLALEVDGPAHFTKNTAKPLGHMLLKHRTLSKMGWTVVSIPFLEWDPIPFWSSMEKKRYLQRKLGITRTIFFGGTDCSNFKGWSTRLGKPSRFV